MAYYGRLDAQNLLDLASSVPQRPGPSTLHSYVDGVREKVNGTDTVFIPESHRGLISGENHEGSIRLNSRIRQLASWFAKGDPLFSVLAAGPSETIRRGSTIQERFARGAEKSLRRGTPLHNVESELSRDLAECGVAIVQHHPRSEFYLKVMESEEYRERMAKGALIDEVIYRRRVDPASFSWVEGDDGCFEVVVVKTQRHLGALAEKLGVDAVRAAFNIFDFGEVNIDHPETWGDAVAIEVAEVWGPENGAILITGSPKPERKKGGLQEAGATRILAEWDHQWQRPPFYLRTVGTQPWHSPLDEMVQLTNERNFWATMLDVQASGAIFRHWQLADSNTGEDITGSLGRDTVPEKILYDPSQPPPDMGPGTEWTLAPFEFHDVRPRYEQIKLDHENAGSSVARLMGQSTNAYTAVGTADALGESASEEFNEWVKSIEGSIEQMWADTFRWIRRFHKDPIYVDDQRRDSEEEIGSFLNTTAAVGGGDVVSERVQVRLDMRNRLAKIADYKLGREMQNNGDIDFETRVEAGLVPYVDDAQEILAALYVSQRQRIALEQRLGAAAMQDRQALMGVAGVPAGNDTYPPPQPNITRGGVTDTRGSGVGQGANNVANSGIAPGGSDTAAGRAA